MESHKNSAQAEMNHKNPDGEKLATLMAIIYAKRHLQINDALTVNTLLTNWPAPFCAVEIIKHVYIQTSFIFHFEIAYVLYM